MDVPLFISYRKLRDRRSLPRACGRWVLDSGAFSELTRHGRWTISPRRYARDVARFREEVGHLDWAAPQDWMCEPHMLKLTGLTVADHQKLTTENFLNLLQIDPGLPIIPVLQGWTLDDYKRHVELYDRYGVDLQGEALVGLGSVCRRQATDEICELIESLAAMGIPLHGFGVKTGGMAKYGRYLSSADSMAWSFSARSHKRPMLEGCDHTNCANCMAYALFWRESLLGRLHLPH